MVLMFKLLCFITGRILVSWQNRNITGHFGIHPTYKNGVHWLTGELLLSFSKSVRREGRGGREFKSSDLDFSWE